MTNSGTARQRERAVRFARASIGLEGFSLSAEEEAYARCFIAGEIDPIEFVRPTGERGQQR